MKIENYEIYNNEMEKSLSDKLFFVSKFNDVDTIVDFGCANGKLISKLKDCMPTTKFIGYDIDLKMLNLARNNAPFAQFTNNWKDIENISDTKALILCSVLHEVYSYSTDEEIDIFWDKVFNTDFKYIVLRDMMPDISYRVSCKREMLDSVFNKLPDKYMWNEYEKKWGAIKTELDLLHLLMKYRYIENFQKEVKENYFPIFKEGLFDKIPDNYEILCCDHYVLPFFKNLLDSEFGFKLSKPTHIKLILKRK